MPIYRLVARPPCRTLVSDASKHVVGGFCLETDQYWRYDLSEEEPARVCESSKHLQWQDGVSINALELLGMLVSTYMLSFSVSVPWRTGAVCCCEVTTRLQYTGHGVVEG